MDTEAHNALTILNFGPLDTFPGFNAKDCPQNALHKLILDRDCTFIVGNQNFKVIFKNAPIVGCPGEQEATQKFLLVFGKTDHFPKGLCIEREARVAGTKAHVDEDVISPGCSAGVD